MFHGDIYRRVIELDRSMRTSFGVVRDVKTKKSIDWYYVKPQFELPLPNLKKSRISLPSKKYGDLCRTCARGAYEAALSKATYYDRKAWPSNVPILSKSWEHYGMWSRSQVAAHESIGVRPRMVLSPEMGDWLKNKYGKRWFCLTEIRVTGK